MCVVYGSVRDFRVAMRDPFNSSRAHAICRKLIATAKQDSVWYGVHYWAACVATSHGEWLGNRLVAYEDRWYVESDSKKVPRTTAQKMWKLAIRRAMNLRDEALKLKTSVAW